MRGEPSLVAMAAAGGLPAHLGVKLDALVATLGEDRIGDDARGVLEHLLGGYPVFFDRCRQRC